MFRCVVCLLFTVYKELTGTLLNKTLLIATNENSLAIIIENNFSKIYTIERCNLLSAKSRLALNFL